jgi:hypothetical protein
MTKIAIKIGGISERLREDFCAKRLVQQGAAPDRYSPAVVQVSLVVEP